MNIHVMSFTGPYCITSADGDEVFNVMRESLDSGQCVELDFGGVGVFSASFFSAAIGPLLQNHSVDELNQRVTMVGLSPDARSILRRVIACAREYYSIQSAKS